uniref:Uncharacterized protein n=1 Tax=Arundo donax TaxID=35708 RepID=A0A0A9HB70_ARUDO
MSSCQHTKISTKNKPRPKENRNKRGVEYGHRQKEYQHAHLPKMISTQLILIMFGYT